MGLNYANNLIKQTSERSRFYSSMGGVDFSGDGSQIAGKRFAYLENMYRDYEGEGEGLIESVPGFRTLFSLGEAVRRIYLQKSGKYGEYLLIVTLTKLYRIPVDERDNPSALSYLGEVPEGDIVGFPCASSFYFVASGSMYVLDGEGVFSRVGFSEGEVEPYIPTTYKNGSVYEQRNLLSSRFRESITLSDPSLYASGSSDLLYEVLSEDEMTCSLVGRASTTEDVLFVPSAAQIGGELYTVKTVKNSAFADDTTLREVHFSEGMEEIGNFAFLRCTNLETVTLSDSVASISGGAFNVCPSLSHFHFGTGFTSMPTGNIFDMCDALATLRFAMAESTFKERFATDPFSEFEKVFSVGSYYLMMEIPLKSRCQSILAFTKDNAPYAYTAVTNGDGLIQSVRFYASDKRLFYNSTVTLIGEYETSTEGRFLGDAGTDIGSPLGARVAELFDGRIFLAGAIEYPNTVFYSARDNTGRVSPTYFGVYNTFDDGVGSFAVSALLSVGNTLAVFKENDDGSGGIFYHTPYETGGDLVPKIYPVSYVHTGLVALGGVISYYDEPIFISENGVCALVKSKINTERALEVRSHRINAKLLRENLGEITLAKWCGYLVLCVAGEMFLGDYRQLSSHPSGTYEYEWYYLSGVGTYTDAHRVYRYMPSPKPPYLASLRPDEVVTAEIYSEIGSDGKMHYFVREGDKKYEAYPTEEMRGGVFHGAKTVFSTRNLLFFATDTGDICVFNNDKRGEPPLGANIESDAELEEYRDYLGRRLHRSYYAFATHAPRYAMYTGRDNCDIPHLSKDDVRGSLSVKCRVANSTHATLEIGTDREGFRAPLDMCGGTLDFSDLDFSSFALSAEEYQTFAIGGRVKNFVEKQIGIFTDTFASPLSVATIAYRYTVRGKIKNK